MLLSLLLFTALISSARGNAGLNVIGIRLAGGSGQYEGRVEVNVNGVWGTICDLNFGSTDAQVLCRMMNLSSTAYFHNARYQQGIGPIFAQNLGCSGHETHIQQCSFQPATSCYHKDDVSIICSECGAISVSNGVISSISSDGTTLSTSCNSGYNSNHTTVTCNGTGYWEPSSISCTKPETKLNITDMRLMNGLGLYDGRVEVSIDGIWGDICTSSFSTNDATAICNMMFGLPRYTHYTYHNYGYGSNSKVHINRLGCTGNEDDINDCYYEQAGYCSSRSRAAVVCNAYPLNNTDIRLADGSGQYDGRVEVKHVDHWGTVCGYKFGTSEGSTLCKMMNLRLTTYYTTAKFGPGSGPVLIGQLSCSSSSTNVNDCNFWPPTRRYCSHNNDVSLVCTECGEANIANGKITSSNGTIMTVTCDTGYGPTTYTLECLSNGTWLQDKTCEVFGYPLNITDMRLANGIGPYDGRLEVQVNGTTWGTVCSSSFSYNELQAVCNIMFGSTKYRTFTTRDYGSGTGPTYIDRLDCTGTETDINQCKYYVLNTCSHRYDVAVVCDATPYNMTDIRLTNGTGSHNGRVEVLVDGEWGTVSNYGINIHIANTLCKMMNLSLWSFYTTPVYGMGSYPIRVCIRSCGSSDTHIDQCSYISPDRNYCSKSALSLACTDNRQDITDLRLIPGPYHGRVEIYMNNTWGTLCGNSFDANDGKVICNMMNGLDVGSTFNYAYYGAGTGPVHIDRLTCSGNEPDINSCSYIYDNSCGHNKDASVLCYGPDLNINGTRLGDGTGPYDGRIEIEVNGTWGTICDHGFHTNDANAFCSHMFGTRAARYFHGATYGQGTGPVHIDQLTCRSGTTDLNKCPYFVTNMCGHERDASVVCYGSDLNINGTRLVDGTGPYDGRIEIEVNGTWGTICDRNFDINDADAFCRMMGSRAAQYFTGARYGEGTGPVHIDELFCSSGTTDLNKCPYVLKNDCGHDRDVGIVCNECGQPEIYYWDIGYFSFSGSTLFADCSYYRTYIGTLRMTCDNNTKTWITEGECQEYSFPLDISGFRLVDGNRSSEGRVEIQSMDTWGTICDDGFGIYEAHTICQMLGFWPAVTYYRGAKYGAGTGPIFVDDLHCGTNISHINDCSYATYDDCDHDDDISVVCLDCLDPTPTNGMINSTNTNYGTVVEISCEPGYRLIGDEIILCEISGNWSDSPYCQYIDCDSPVPSHGTVNSTSTTNGTVVSVTCDKGYNLSGEAIITCQENDTWTDYPTCKILDCGVPYPSNADVELPSNDTTYGEIAVITCKHGYLPDGSATVSCLETGIWEDIPVCEIVDCGDPTPNKGSVNDTNTTYGTVVEITCDDGHDMRGNSTIECQIDGTWSDSPICDANDCGRPSVSNGQVDITNGTTAGSIVAITCNPGYDLVGSAVIECLAAGWNDTSMDCVLQDCGDPTPEHGKLVTSTGTKYGDTATIECNQGHKMEGDSTITCEDGGQWSSDTVCVIRDCGKLTNPDNGNLVHSSGTVFDSTVIFSCNSEFLLVGESMLLCSNDGTWSNDVPSCVKLANIGESCVANEYCKADGAVCKQSVCSCNTGVYDKRTDKCDTMPLYPYGISQGDYVVPNLKECDGKVTFPAGIPLFEQTHTKLFVCSHGLVSFGRRYITPTPPTNKKKVKILNRDMLAPFNAHFNTSSPNTAVYYRSYDVLDSYGKLIERPEVRDIESRVQQFGATRLFKASFVLIATWENVLPDGADFNTAASQASTFQLVLVYNGVMAYSFYIYPSGMMKWVASRLNYAPVWVGYYGKKDTPFTHHSAFSPTALALDKRATHQGISGVVFKSLVGTESTTTNNNVSCITWYQENKHEKQHIDRMNSWLPQCPCDISLARWDPWFWHIDRWNRNQNNFTCVDMFPGRTFRPYGKSCCYDYRTSLWVDERPIAGGFFRYHPENTADHYEHDVVPKEMCCSPLTPFCKFYYDLRPTGTCYRESPYSFGTFWGDPHFQTLDGQNFTFNGLGEYTLLQIQTDNNTFDLQARTERATKEDGNFSDATVFSAFAAKDETNASIHVELNRAKQGFSMYGNGIDLKTQYLQKTDNDTPLLDVPGGTLFVSKRGDTLVVLFPSSGISLNISVTVGMLSLSSIVPKKFHNVTRGLLGNYNGKVEDDFTLPNGTILRANISEREIFRYGQNWVIDGANSAFIYPDRKNHSDYHNATYVPRFLDEVDKEKRLEAEEVCNGKENIECVFDYVFTDRKDIAEATNMLKGNADKTKNEMDEVVPSLIGCENINATLNHQVYCPIQVDDGNSVVFLANNVNASYNPSTKYISYFQTSDEPVDLRVVATNSNGRTSPAFIVVILLCTGCNGRGYCTDVPRDDVRNNEYFKYAKCECQSEYEGPDCENVYDGCADDPCSLGRNCTSLTVVEQRLNNRTFVCDPCPSGFMTIDQYNDTCIDIDECKDNPCRHTCINTEDSYECTCNHGYRIDSRDKQECTDINECEDLNTPHNCEQNCTNTDGSYNCSCFNGFILQSGNCKLDISQESQCLELTCSENGGCSINEEGKAVCFCDTGYELELDNSCRDIDECKRNVCPQMCNNTIGGFECSCFPGYKLDGLTTCQECDIGYWGENCQNTCECTGEGVESCDPVKGCICEEGWQGDTCDEDINECNTTTDICGDPRSTCTNVPGSFYCKCLDGFIETDNGKCEDIDECSIPPLHSCDQICKNNIGSYSCECKPGFKSTSTGCENIDECVLKSHDCEQMCDDNPGSYNCFCYFGYTLNDDRITCTKLSDPCMTMYGLNCSHYCYISPTKSECRCRDGFRLGSDSQTCTDIDECTDENHTCYANAECRNTDGSYTCECPVGSKLENDGRTCTECDGFHYGANCASSCSCLHGRCDPVTGCQCDEGWRGNNCDIDFNECDAREVTCSGQNEVCINTPGNAICECLNGYTRIESGVCVDIDECLDGRLNTCDQSCVNLPGGYTCECQSGFMFIDGKCQDINECETQKSDCEQLCENTLGSYRCYCEDGFKLNLTNRVSCKAASECSTNLCGDHAICFNDNGIENCRCMNGFHNTTGTCKDIDECKMSPTPCSQHCNNTLGSYNCRCDEGYYLAKDDQTCLVCEAGTFGPGCSTDCSCNEHNSESCDHITGECRCKPGWEGTHCNSDVDECKDETICPEHSTCSNEDGDFDCKCDVGYFKTSFGSCTVCDDNHYGGNCVQRCKCLQSNTASCNNINGICECKKGWKGEDCTVDVDECDADLPDPCIENSTCENNQGSFTCKCNEGFRKMGDSCVDIDECVVSTSKCDQTCVNTIGNFICKCEKGFHGYWNNCEECSGHTYGDNCTETCGCKKTNTDPVERDNQICDRVTGACDCLVNWKGEFCEEDVDECNDENICNSKPNSGCVNNAGWYNCQCYRGYLEVDDNCVRDQDSTTTQQPETGISIDYILTIGLELLEMDDLMTPATYDKYEELSKTSLMEFYKQYTTAAIIIVINELRKGSLIIDYTVMYEHNDARVVSDLVTAAKSLADESMFTFDDETYTADITSVCEAGTFGPGCSTDCSCNEHNSESCDHITGECRCKPGWEGTNCNSDVDECKDETICPKHSTCSNEDGDFDCKCDVGYFKTSFGSCTECSGHTYGDNCTETCGCKKTNTDPVEWDNQICDRVTGACDCLVNWKGEFCEEDVDECNDENICNSKPNSGCVNNAGWYNCQCYRGYLEVDDNCVRDQDSTTTQQPETGISIDYILTIGLELPEMDDLMTPATYDKYEELSKTSLMEFYKQYTTAAIIIVINELRKGSLIIDYTVMYEHNDARVVSDLVTATKSLADESMFTFDDETYTADITSDSYDYSDDPCKILNDLGACKLDNCDVVNDIAQCRTETSWLDMPAIIGISVGCGVVVLIVTVVIIVCIRKNTNSKKQRKEHYADRRSLPRTPISKLGFEDVCKWQENQSLANTPRYMTWRSWLTKPMSDQDENMYGDTYKIPRAHAKQPPSYSSRRHEYL